MKLNFQFLPVWAWVVLSLVTSTRVCAEISMPPQQQVGDVTYMTGGIAEEAEMMRAVANDYALEVVLVQKRNEQEEFLADVAVRVLDAQHNVLLETNTEGPYFYADLPAGRYVVEAKFNDVVKQQKVKVSEKSHQKLVFWWPITEPTQDEEAAE